MDWIRTMAMRPEIAITAGGQMVPVSRREWWARSWKSCWRVRVSQFNDCNQCKGVPHCFVRVAKSL